MAKMTKEEYNRWVQKLKKYWQMWGEEYEKFLMKERQIEELMRKEIGEELEFFYIDGSVAGIGHSDWSRHSPKHKKYFPLIHDCDLDKEA